MNNTIDSDVVIHDNVIIGNNNIIKSGTIIYENVVIGNNNIILENNIIGCLPVEANVNYNEIKKNGLTIGNNNFFHISNKISSGYYNTTIIGNNNKFLSDVYISHDNIIHNNVVFYPRVFSAGLVEYFSYSNIGAGAHIHQKCRIGSYSMVGMNCTILKNIMPFFVSIGYKYTRLNKIKMTDDMLLYENIFENIFELSNEKKDIGDIKKIINTLPNKYKFLFKNILY
jgi:UDP-N-acetylglucosamine acyltransferase